MMKKKGKKSILPKSKKSQSSGKAKHGRPPGGAPRRPGGAAKGGGRRQRRAPADGADDELQQRQQRIEELRRSLGMPARAARAGAERPGGPDAPSDEVDTEGLEHLLKAAKRGHISLMEDEDSGEEGAADGAGPGRRKRPRAEDSSSSEDEDEEREYEQEPRSFPVVRDLLPIKTKVGVVKRKMLVKTPEDPDRPQEEEQDAQEEGEEDTQAAPPPPADATRSVAEIYAERRAKIDAAKLRIGLLSRALLETPQEKFDNLYRLLDLLAERDPAVMVTVRKYAAASLLEVFKDLLPGYRLQEHDLTQKLKKETIATYKYENALINSYKKYLIKLEEYTKALGSDQTPLKGLAMFCLDCMCQCLVRFRDFNFASNLVGALVPHTSHRDEAVRAAVSAAIRTVFAEDRSAERTLEIVRKLSQLIKAKQFDCRRDITDLFLALRIKNVDLDRERDADAKAKKFMNFKEKLKAMSRKERKRSKKLEALERELMATRAEENKQDKQKRHSEILTVVFTVYFKILRQLPRSALMSSVLEGLAKFAHMINVDFFHDLVDSFHGLLASGTLQTTRQVLLCVQTVFVMLSGQGEAINIDPQRFYGHCYRALNDVCLEDTSDEFRIALSSLDVMLIRRRKKISPQRVLSFTKRLASLALRAPHPAAAAALMMIRALSMVHSCTSRLLDTESVASGLYRPEVDDPEYCGAGNTLLYELTALRRSYHQPVRTLAAHVMLSCPVQGDFALPAALRQQSATDILDMYSTAEMRFTPAVTPPSIVKKRSRKARPAAAGDSQWLLDQETAAGRASEARVDFASCLRADSTGTACAGVSGRPEWPPG
ncbi:nucleolar complex protein 3 homolog isoform X2 [Amphibalanus amphitrite]|nr:nucleolar complex protein 3 homolog isoform X2 [Amphibalanus amphitrite]XP_043207764.1 nucleolar complex protein 3 homolog isoform X2 [Amphibalanus amphitrite]XP_043207765.1 nucleolar complex protein 3 homolog isoform X2 [Amphibalanus amphitrite]XP_043207767.1 nucleolar complex protein 3 homolog isoform X2 [Amphibalanus amphitrite]XP_043207768.1 nucleolar complex protein 3 homolog isoform X2 [Amphibalanus amphitrite]XP_043207769.1 nucleolar complex protein 3 homolog isoform X2 [Amphibalanus